MQAAPRRQAEQQPPQRRRYPWSLRPARRKGEKCGWRKSGLAFRRGAVAPRSGLPCSGRQHFDRKDFLYRVLAGNHAVDDVQRRGMEVPFPALRANLSLDVLDNVQSALVPVLLLDRPYDRVCITEFAFHVFTLSCTR